MLTPIGRDYVKSTNDESESHELQVHLSTQTDVTYAKWLIILLNL